MATAAPVVFPLALPASPVISPGDVNTELYAEIERLYKAIWQTAAQITSGGAGTVTNAAPLTNHAIVVGRGVNAVAALAAATDGQIPIGVTGADPNLLVLSGDATMNNAGVVTLTAAAKGGFDIVVMQAFS